MEPTLNHGDRIFVSRAMAFSGTYDRGDLVMVRIYDDEGSRYIIKRIIARPGDVFVIDDGKIFINDELSLANCEAYIAPNLSLALPDNYYFLMGDNTSLSTDSRDFGPLHRSDIKGRVLFRFMGGSLNIY